MAGFLPHVCVLFDVRNLDGFAGENFLRVSTALRDLCDVYAVCHGKDYVPRAGNRIVLDDRAIFSEIQHEKDVSRGVVPGNCDLKFLRACREVPAYDHVLWWEWDVVCTRDIRGTVQDFFKATAHHDLAASYFRRRFPIRSIDKWMWWDTLHIPGMPADESLRSASCAFFPLFGASRAFIEGYTSLLAQGWRGHFEVAMPTAARYLSLRCLDISRSRARFTHYPQFTVTAPRELEAFVPPFIHPIKSSDAFDSAMDIATRTPRARGGRLGRWWTRRARASGKTASARGSMSP